MPLIPITDQKRKRMLNDLAKIDTLKNQLKEKKQMVEDADFDISDYMDSLNQREQNIVKCRKVINIMKHNTIDDIRHKQNEEADNAQKIKQKLQKFIKQRSNLILEIQKMENTTQGSHKKNTKLKKQVQAKKEMVKKTYVDILDLQQDLNESEQTIRMYDTSRHTLR